MMDLTKAYKRSNFKRDCKKKGLNFEDYIESEAGRSGDGGKGTHALYTYSLIVDHATACLKLATEYTEIKDDGPNIINGQIFPAGEGIVCKLGDIGIEIMSENAIGAELTTDIIKPKKLPRKLKQGLTASTIKTIEATLGDVVDHIESLPNTQEVEPADRPKRKKNKTDISHYEQNSTCRSDFKKVCKNNLVKFEDFIEIKDDYYVRPSGLRDMRYFYRRR